MANFANPTVGSNYTNFPVEIRASVDAALQMLSSGSHTNIPTGAIKWDAGLKRFVKYNGSSFDNLTDEYRLDANVNLNRADFGNNDRARFGDSQQLQIYTNGTHSYIQESGSGALQIRGANIIFDNQDGSERYIDCNANGSVELYNDNQLRLVTDGNGIQVTSRVGIGRSAGLPLDVEGNAQIGAANNSNAELKVGRSGSGDRIAIFDLIGDNHYGSFGFRIVRNNGQNATSKLIHRGTGDFELVTEEAADIVFKPDGTQRATISSGGSFGLGVSSPSAKFHLKGASGTYPTFLVEHSNVDTEGEFLRIGRTDISGIRYHSIKARHGGGSTGNNLSFHLHNSSTTTSQSEILRMRGDGKIGISTTTPEVTLDVGGLSSGGVAGLNNSVLYAGFTNNTNFGGIVLGAGSNGNSPFVASSKKSNGTALSLDLMTNATSRIRINDDGACGVGTTNPNRKFHIAGTSGQTILELQRTNANTGGAVGTISFTASDGHSVSSISAIADGDNEGANIVFRTTSAAANNDPYNAATPTRFTITSTGNLKVPDDGRLIFGAGNGTDGDLQIYHTGNNNYIDCPASGTGHLIIKADDFLVQGSNAESMIKGIENAGVELFHNNNSKFFTTSTGAVVTGRLGVGTEQNPSVSVDIKSADNTLLLLESTDRHALLEIHDTGGSIALGNDEGKLRLMTGGSDRLRINSSGVGIGTTSPDHTLEIRQTSASHQIVSINRANSNTAAMYLGNDTNDNAIFSVNGDSNNLRFGKDVSGTFTQFLSINTNGDLFVNNDRHIKFGTSNVAYIKGNDNSYLAFGVNNEVFRISANALRIGQTSDDTVGQDDTNVGASIEKNGRISSSTSDATTGLNLNANTTSTSKHYISFRKSGTQIGSVKKNSGDSVSYNTTSDRRLKENIVDIKDALLTLLKLKPKQYNWKSDENKISEHGFIAQDLLEDKICEYAVGHSKDDDWYGMDYGRLTAITIAAIQELVAKVSDLETKLG